MAKGWTCRGCRQRWSWRKKRCDCGRKAPVRRKPAHALILDVPYELWVERFGEFCNICGRPPSKGRRLDRDHDHRTGEARGLLCWHCNKQLRGWMTARWLRKAADYLELERERWP